MPNRRWMWVRPSPHIYSYNRDKSSFAYNSASASSTSQSSRALRATSEVATSRAEETRTSRATSAAPEPGMNLVGYTGYYGRQLALLNEKMASKKAVAASASASSSTATAASAAAAQSKSVSASMSSTSMKKTVERQETTVSKETMASKKVALQQRQETSIKEGRNSVSRAVRRAEYHAETSGRDPRHVGVPRDTSDDIIKKVADIHMSPYEGREIHEAKAALSQGKLKVEKMEKELAAITVSAMKYKSLYSKTASQMAAEAMQAVESEAASTKKVRKTVVEERKRVAAA